MSEKQIEHSNPFTIVEAFESQRNHHWYLLFLTKDHQRIDWFINLN
jgi:hypothetical protein